MGAAQANAVVGSDVVIPRYGQAPHAPAYGYPPPGYGQGYGYGYGAPPAWQPPRYGAPVPADRDHRGRGARWGAGGNPGIREIRREEWEARHPGQSWWHREHRRNHWERLYPGVPFVGAEALAESAAKAAACPPAFCPPAPVTAPMGPTPRAWLTPAAAPTMGNRQVLPMNTGGQNVDVGLTAIITSRPQRVAFRPERVFVSATGTSTQGAAAWLLNDITIGNRSQYVQQGALPGDMFATGAIDSFITFETAQTAMDVTVSVTFNDASVSGGQPFYGSLIGTAAM